jgi:hypothetical protein
MECGRWCLSMLSELVIKWNASRYSNNEYDQPGGIFTLISQNNYPNEKALVIVSLLAAIS